MVQKRTSIAGIMERTLLIATLTEPKEWGTAFAMEFGDQQYLITANHVAADFLPKRTSLFISSNGRLETTPADVVLSDGDPDKGAVDVAVLRLPEPLSFRSKTPTPGRPEELFVTQRVAMPTAEHFGHHAANRAPLVVTRTGSVAAILDPAERGPYTGDMMLNMLAYPGFSGSPIIYWDRKGRPKIGAVAARYSWNSIPDFEPGKVNSGFIGCFHIKHALNLIRSIA